MAVWILQILCYDKDVWCRMNNVRIKEGEYTCLAWYQAEKGNYNGIPYNYKVVGIIGIYLMVEFQTRIQ